MSICNFVKGGGRAKLSAAACVWIVLACAAGPRAGASDPASPAVARAERVTPAGEVVLVLNEQFLNALLEAIATQPEPLSYPLSRAGVDAGGAGDGCQSQITLLPESGGARTSVRFVGGRITAPVAFRGSYKAPLVGCLRFEGWADTFFDLEFDRTRQALNARVQVREVKLRNVPSLMTGGITGLVQDAINGRVNPVEILRAEQLGAPLPAASRNSLRLRAREVRHEVAGKELRLRILYEIVRAD